MVLKLSFNLFYVMNIESESKSFVVLSTALVQLIFYDNIKHCDKLNIFACTTLFSSHAYTNRLSQLNEAINEKELREINFAIKWQSIIAHITMAKKKRKDVAMGTDYSMNSPLNLSR